MCVQTLLYNYDLKYIITYYTRTLLLILSFTGTTRTHQKVMDIGTKCTTYNKIPKNVKL